MPFQYTGTMADFYPELLECDHMDGIEIVLGHVYRTKTVYYVKCCNCRKTIDKEMRIRNG